jgi:hypothetical protein
VYSITYEASVMTIQIPMELKHRIEIIAEEQSLYWKGCTKQKIIEGFDNTIKKVKNL